MLSALLASPLESSNLIGRLMLASVGFDDRSWYVATSSGTRNLFSSPLLLPPLIIPPPGPPTRASSGWEGREGYAPLMPPLLIIPIESAMPIVPHTYRNVAAVSFGRRMPHSLTFYHATTMGEDLARIAQYLANDPKRCCVIS